MDTHCRRMVACLCFITFLTGNATERVNKTAVLGSSETFSCTIQSSDLASWVDVTNNVAIFNLNHQREVLRTMDAEADKYNHYTAELASDTQFVLNIAYVNTTDVGGLVCENLISRVDFIQYNFAVEVPPDDIAVDCSSCTRASSSCNCQCSASGGTSPSTLRLEWKINDDVLAGQPSTEKNTSRGQMEYSSSAVVLVKEDNSVVTCTVAGFENQDEIADLFPSRIEAKQTLRSPVCIVLVSDDNCPTVELSCSCDAFPNVPNSPEYFSYYSRQGEEDTGSDTLLNGTSHNVTPGGKTYFVCTGNNGLSFSTKSAAVPNPCREDTTILPFTTPNIKTSDDPTQPSAPALIAICCVEGVVIIAMIFVFVFLRIIRKGSRKEDEQSLATPLQDTTNKTNAGYMDLQEAKQLSPNHVNNEVDVPFDNLNLQAPFPAKGLMKYRKAQMILTSKREEIVVKTVSDDAPVRLAKLQADEVRELATLTSNVNVVQFLGRCNNVPNLLCYEFVNGTKLGECLRENFQPSKIHQYGNTKQKRYHVPEKGSVESLPRVALQIVRGMKYLTAQKFLHPGLRSEKVIIDVFGQCKLYDFVSQDNAKDIMEILWGQSVPYQWMPPEYLFLDKLGPSVDVWSFGVLMWEIFTYGALPYEGKSRSEVEKQLRGKEYLALPNNCPGAIWQITLNCWSQSPEKRPSFDHLSLQLSHMCNDNKEYDEIKST